MGPKPLQLNAFIPIFKGMKRLLALLAFALLPTLAHAQTPPAGGATAAEDPWFYFAEEPNMFSVPSGMMNIPDASQGRTLPTTAANITPTDDDLAMFQGCGGVGQSDYTSALFNMPEVFDKFKRDVNSELAKQILTYNYSLPQTAALFDTLNAYGNARYQQFQTACKLDNLKQDAKNQFLAACVKARLPERRTIVTEALRKAQEALQNSQNQQPNQNEIQAPNKINPVNSADQIAAQAYAQAWEICSLQYSNDSQAIALRRTEANKFVVTILGSENVNVAIRNTLCPTETSGQAATSCWINLFIPQVRLCHTGDLTGGCQPTTDYGVLEAPLAITAYFDILRFAMYNGVVPKLIEDLQIEISDNGAIAPSILEKAAQTATLNLARVTNNNPVSATDPTVRAFQTKYLNCKNSDIGFPLRIYRQAINAAMTPEGENAQTPTGVLVTDAVTQFRTAEYRTELEDQIRLPASVAQAETDALYQVIEASLGCTANNVIPIFDPQITASLENQCDAEDIDAFYNIASNDVATTATRDLYRFIALRLKQAYARLLTEKGAGIDQTNATAGLVNDSPELRQRLAAAVKEVMIPAVETQISRLDELEKSRGEFGKRVQKIYSHKSGCVVDSGD